MGEVEDAALIVVELPEQEHQAGDEETDIAGGDDDLHLQVFLGQRPQLLAKFLRRAKVLDNVEQQDDLDVRQSARPALAVQIGDIEFVESRAIRGRELIEADDAAPPGVQGRAQMPWAAADVHHDGSGGRFLDRFRVGADKIELGPIVVVAGIGCADLEIAPVNESVVLEPGDS